MKFSGDEFLEIAPKFRKRKKNSSLCVYVLRKTFHQEISRPSRAVTAKSVMHVQCCCFGYKTYCFFDVLVAVALLKLPNNKPRRLSFLEFSRYTVSS